MCDEGPEDVAAVWEPDAGSPPPITDDPPDDPSDD